MEEKLNTKRQQNKERGYTICAQQVTICWINQWVLEIFVQRIIVPPKHWLLPSQVSVFHLCIVEGSESENTTSQDHK